MKILFLTAHLPLPHFSGGRMREFELIRRLGKSFEIHLCSVTKTWHMDNNHIDDLRCFCANIKLFRSAEDDKKDCSTYSDQMKKHASRQADQYISSLLRKEHFDVVHVEGYYLMQHLPIKIDIPVLLVEHNIECLLSLQRCKLASTKRERLYYWREYLCTLKWERIFWKRARICVTLTTEDKKSLSQIESRIDVKTIPNGIDHVNMKHELALSNCNSFLVDDKYHRVLFVGNFAYQPNTDAALYFSDLIFPMILKNVPNTKLFLVGNAPPPQIRSLKSNELIEVTGYVDSLYPFYRAADVVICPLRIGGGVKVKILEALAAGKAIVSTSIGAQGLDRINCKPVIIADDVSDFAKKVIWLLLNPSQRHKQEQKASSYARNIPNWNEASESFIKCYRKMLDSRCHIKN